jgi:hypothetical protein
MLSKLYRPCFAYITFSKIFKPYFTLSILCPRPSGCILYLPNLKGFVRRFPLLSESLRSTFIVPQFFSESLRPRIIVAFISKTLRTCFVASEFFQSTSGLDSHLQIISRTGRIRILIVVSEFVQVSQVSDCHSIVPNLWGLDSYLQIILLIL